jgi:nucleotide-binding universal stress UspA family protein
MNDVLPGAAVVVGIDGSKAAEHAATWAVDEAIARDVPVRLVCVTGARPPGGLYPNEIGLELEYAESVLRQASAAVHATGKNVKVDVEIASGAPVDVLLAESLTAEMVCVGSSGIGAVSSRLVGSTATTLADEASCPVAIIRHHDSAPGPEHRWIGVAVKAAAIDEDIVLVAMQEARLRDVPVLAIGLWQEDFGYTPYDELDRMMESWRQRFPDVRVYPVTTRSGLTTFLNDDDEPVGLVVIGPDEAGHVAQLVGPHSHPILGHPECSVIVVRTANVLSTSHPTHHTSSPKPLDRSSPETHWSTGDPISHQIVAS